MRDLHLRVDLFHAVCRQARVNHEPPAPRAPFPSPVQVCYYYGDPRAVYERLGHAEVVQLALSAEDPNKAEAEFKAFAQRYFKQFVRTPAGMMRSDPQDAGPGYRNVIGLPGGTSSPFFKLLEDANVNKMELRPGKGNPGEGPEEDLVNVVWVVDSNQLPFYRAEKWHQFHNGVGRKYPDEYTRDLKKAVEATGKIESTGCPEFPWL